MSKVRCDCDMCKYHSESEKSGIGFCTSEEIEIRNVEVHTYVDTIDEYANCESFYMKGENDNE